MKIKHSQEINDQLRLATGLKTELLRLIRRKMLRAKSDESKLADWQRLLRQVELSAPGFEIKVKARPAAEIDRRTSMLTGPFYTSVDFPMPIGGDGAMMFPILQLELTAASAAIQQPLGNGLLQLWYDLAAEKEFIRVVPWATVRKQAPSDFLWISTPGFECAPLPLGWNRNPCGAEVNQIVELLATGMESQPGYISACYQDLAPEEPDWLGTLLMIFGEKAPYHFRSGASPIKLFGSFYGIQYCAADVGMNCLMSMGWYVDGGAELFYRTVKGKPTEFSFWNCAR